MAWTRRPLRRIFEPYFTTKGTLGHGLGLSTSIGIVAQSHGMLAVKSKPGIGTTFELLLPIVANDNETLNPQMGRIISSIAA
jgi:two-component system, cell cycle sensor histidine kinase and response regulator CckA